LSKVGSPLSARPAQAAAPARLTAPSLRRGDAPRTQSDPRASASPLLRRDPSQAAPLEFGRIAVEHRPAGSRRSPPPVRRRADRPAPAPPSRRARLRPRTLAARPVLDLGSRSRAGVPGGPAPPASARDPATLIESVRAAGARSSLPILEALGRALRVPLGRVEVYSGGAARRVCELLGARALAANHVLLFAEDSPSPARVAHELAHVLQQRGHRSPVARFEPGSLAVVARDASPEREAEDFARSGGPAWRLSRAPAAVYRASGPPGLDVDEDDLDDERERRFQRFLRKVEGKELGLDDRDPPVFCRKKDETDPDAEPEGKYKRSSGKKFAHADYAGALGGSSGVLDGELPAIWKLGSKWRLSKVGFKEEEARKYAVTGSGPYQEFIYEIATPDRKEPTPEDNAQSLRDYRKACQAINNKKIRTWERSWKPPVANTSRVTGDELGKARDEMEERIVWAYEDDVDGLFDQVIKPAVFAPPYTRIQGNIFEKWVKKNRPGYEKGTGQPLFQDKRLTKDRFGDLVIRKGTNLIIGEVKAVASKPGKEQIQQIADYYIILTRKPPIQGRYLEDPEDSKTEKTVVFSGVKYFFPNKEVAKAWMPALFNGFKKRTDLFDVDPSVPKGLPKKKGKLGTRTNPFIDVVIDDLDDATNLTHRLENPPVKNAGLKVRFFEVTLEEPGYPAISSGQVSIELDVKGGALASEKPTLKKLTPVKPGEQPAAASSELDRELVATTENGVADVKPSGLDRFLKRVHAEAKLTDDGLTGRIWADPGESFIPKIHLDRAEIAASYILSAGFAASGTVEVSYAPAPAKFRGSVSVSYQHGKWSLEGKATVADLIQGLEPFTVSIKHADDVTTIGAADLSIGRKVRGIDIHGKVKSLSYDVDKGSFSADGVHLDVDLGVFGKASADATIRDNELDKAHFGYESMVFAYPGKAPILSGQLTGGLDYDKGKYSGRIGGTANLKIPALQRISKSLGDLGFVIDVGFKDDGKYSGSIALADDKPILLGEYLRIPTLKLQLGEDGSITSTFGLEATEKLKYVKDAKVLCRINADGTFEVLSASARAKVGDETKDRVAAELGLSYQKGKDGQPAFILSGKLWVRIKEGMVAVGTLTYNTATGIIDASLSVERITLLGWHGHKPLLGIKKQIILVSIYGLGIYLDARFELGFDYSFDLGVTPQIKLEGLKIDDFSFTLAVATVRLDGMLVAGLVGKPGIGLGLFALHPKLLRGGGGLALPVSAKAVVNPAGTVEIRYNPRGEVEGGARVGLVLTFGITASLKPYAEFSVLDGLYEPTWEGDALAEFVIMEPRELFTYWIDFGAGLKKTEGEPEMPPPGGDGKPPAKGADEKKRIGTDQPPGKAEEPPHGKRNEELPEKPKEEPEKGKKGGGFDFGTMVDKLLDSPRFQPIKKVLDAAAATFGAIRDFFKAIYNFFKKWFGAIQEAIDSFIEAIKTIAEKGLIFYFKQLLQRKLGPLYDIIAPLFDALEKVAGKFEDLIAKLMDNPIPLTPIAFLKWVLGVLADVFQIAVSGIVEFVQALRKVLANAADAFLKFVNYLVQEGKIGVKRYVYYIPGIIHNTYFYAPTEYKLKIWGLDIGPVKIDGDLVGLSDVLHPSRVIHKAVAFVLWEFLDAFSQIKSTGGYNDPDVDDDTRRNYWVDKND